MKLCFKTVFFLFSFQEAFLTMDTERPTPLVDTPAWWPPPPRPPESGVTAGQAAEAPEAVRAGLATKSIIFCLLFVKNHYLPALQINDPSSERTFFAAT